jgi:histidinol-phosphate aminotransferase
MLERPQSEATCMSAYPETGTKTHNPAGIEQPAAPEQRIATRRAWMQTGGAAALCSLAPQAAHAAGSLAQAGPGRAAMDGRNLPRGRLSLNENAFGCSAGAVEAIRNNLGDLSRYTERDAESLTAQIAAKEHVSSAQVVLGAGVLAALGTHLSVAAGPGGEFIYSIPGFTELVDAAEQTGGVAVGIPLNQRLGNDLPAIAAHVNSGTRAVYVVNPHNPSGTVSASADLRSFISNVSQRTPVIVDEAYVEFTDSFADRTLAPMVSAGHNVIVFRTFDKVYGLAALQFGYAIAPAAFANTLRQRGVGASHGLNRLAVVAAAAALRDARFVDETRDKTAIERARWHRALEDLGLRHSDSQANFIFFQSGRPHEEVAAEFLAQGIQIGRSFPPLDQWVRISIGLPEENNLAIAALRKVFAA